MEDSSTFFSYVSESSEDSEDSEARKNFFSTGSDSFSHSSNSYIEDSTSSECSSDYSYDDDDVYEVFVKSPLPEVEQAIKGSTPDGSIPNGSITGNPTSKCSSIAAAYQNTCEENNARSYISSKP